MLASEGEESLAIDTSRPLFRSKEVVQEQLVERLDILGSCLGIDLLVSNDLHWLTLVLLDLSGAHLDLHVVLREALHGRSKGSATSSVGVALAIVSSNGVVVWIRSVSILVLEGTLQLGKETRMASDVSNEIELHDGVGRDVWSLVLETTVHVDGVVVMRPNGVSESLNRVELLPF